MVDSAPPMMPLRLRHRSPIAQGIHIFEIGRSDGGQLPEFTAGAHVSLRVPNGEVRKYSLCNDPGERDRYAFAVQKEMGGRGGSVSLIDRAQIGAEILVAPPVNNFALSDRASSYLFIAGGIGITPFMSMIRFLRSSSGVPRFKLAYCTRTPEATAFRAELCAPALSGLVQIHHDQGDPARALDLWRLLERPTGAHVYCCGPRSLMEDVRAMTGHWSPSAVHFESFVDGAATRKPTDTAFRVRLARTGDLVAVSADETILEALRAKGHRAPSSCESGTCGTCRTRLLNGEAEHRDLVLSEGERGTHIMLCVSRARSEELVIDR